MTLKNNYNNNKKKTLYILREPHSYIEIRSLQLLSPLLIAHNCTPFEQEFCTLLYSLY